LPVADESLVGEFGLQREFAFPFVVGAVSVQSCRAWLPFRAGRAGEQFEPA